MKKAIARNKWLVLILIIASFLRLYRIPSYMEFLGDQGRDALVVRQFLTKGDLMFIGPQTSIGNMYLGPWYYYLMAPALLLAGLNPVGPAIMVAGLGVLAVWLIWKVGKEWFDETTGLLAALFLAISPVVTYYNIFSWNPNIIPFFSLLAMWYLFQIWQKKNYRKIPWLVLSLVMILNSHYLGLLVFPVVVLFLLLSFWPIRKKIRLRKSFLKSLWLATILFILLMLPLVLFDFKHEFANFQSFKAFFLVRQTTVNLKFYKGIAGFWKITNQLLANLIVRKDSWAWSMLLFPFLLIGAWQAKKSKPLMVILVWFLAGLLGLSNYKQHIYAHYFGFLWPAAILLLVVGLKKLWPWSLIAVLFLSWSMLTHWHGFSSPVNQLARAQKVASFILKTAEGEKFSLGLIAQCNYDPPYRYYLEDRKPSLTNLHEEMTEQLFVICEPWGEVDCNPLGHPQWQIAVFGQADMGGEWEVEGVKVFKLVHSN
ncbi:glycosyltransferase family 39 protein [Candidatus Shapirobacteria bacterium]|nr:glycosyltransferase family 39 protein [Candidatus Shapirobacteria bacterium]